MIDKHKVKDALNGGVLGPAISFGGVLKQVGLVGLAVGDEVCDGLTWINLGYFEGGFGLKRVKPPAGPVVSGAIGQRVFSKQLLHHSLVGQRLRPIGALLFYQKQRGPSRPGK